MCSLDRQVIPFSPGFTLQLKFNLILSNQTCETLEDAEDLEIVNNDETDNTDQNFDDDEFVTAELIDDVDDGSLCWALVIEQVRSIRYH